MKALAYGLALVIGLALGSGAAGAQSWPTLPLDDSVPHGGFDFVTRYDGSDWYSERSNRGGGDYDTWWSYFDLFRGSFSGGRTAYVSIYDGNCSTGMVMTMAIGSGKTWAELAYNVRWFGGYWHRPKLGSPEAIRFGQLCATQALALGRQGQGG